MSVLKTQIAYDTLVDTGVSLRIRLNTDPVTPREAEAFFGFLSRSLEVQFAAWKEAIGSLGIVPIIEVRSGSIEAIIRFMQEKTKDGKEFARDVAKDIAKDIAKAVFWAVLTFPGVTDPPEPPHNLPQVVEQCATGTVHPEIEKLVNVLEESGKPFTVEIFEGKVVIRGNELTSTQPRRPARPKDGDFTL
jgi:hypothetical protein